MTRSTRNIAALLSIALAATIAISARAQDAKPAQTVPTALQINYQSPDYCRPGLFTTPQAARNCMLNVPLSDQLSVLQELHRPRIVPMSAGEREAILEHFRK